MRYCEYTWFKTLKVDTYRSYKWYDIEARDFWMEQHRN